MNFHQLLCQKKEKEHSKMNSNTFVWLGPNAMAQEVLLGNYHGERCLGGGFACIQTPLAAIQKIARKVSVSLVIFHFCFYSCL
jgi:hypothetical protein